MFNLGDKVKSIPHNAIGTIDSIFSLDYYCSIVGRQLPQEWYDEKYIYNVKFPEPIKCMSYKYFVEKFGNNIVDPLRAYENFPLSQCFGTRESDLELVD